MTMAVDSDYYDWIRAGKQIQDRLSFVRADGATR
jgi:hypothetical protein